MAAFRHDLSIERGGETLPLYPVQYAECVDSGLQVPACDHIERAIAMGLPELKLSPVHSGRSIIVGAGPSIKNHESQIRDLSLEPGSHVFAINWAHDWLMDRGIRVDASCLYEISCNPYTNIFQRENFHCTYYVGSLSYPTIIKSLLDDGRKVMLFHVFTKDDDQLEILKKHGKSLHLGGGQATLLRAINIDMWRGYRSFHVFGADSSFDGDSHVNGSPYNKNLNTVEVYVEDDGKPRAFTSYSYLVQQADEFKNFYRVFHGSFREMEVYGDGLLPFVFRKLKPKLKEGTQ